MQINTNNILNNIQLNLIKISAENRVDNDSNKELYDSLNSDISASTQNIMNFNDAVGYMQIADTTLNNVSKQTDELNTLKIASNNGALNSDQQAMIQSQMQDIANNITKTINEANYNGRNVFSGDFKIGDMNINLNLPKLDITNEESINNFTKSVTTLRSDISSFMNSATSNIDNLTQKIVDETNSKSNYEVDFAKTINEIKQNELKLNSATLAQAHNSDILANNIQMLLGM